VRPEHGDQVPVEQDLDAGVHLLHPGVVRRDVRPATIEPPHPLRIALRQTILVPAHPSVPPIRVFRSSSTPSRNSSSSFMALSKASFIASAKIGVSVMSVSLFSFSLCPSEQVQRLFHRGRHTRRASCTVDRSDLCPLSWGHPGGYALLGFPGTGVLDLDADEPPVSADHEIRNPRLLVRASDRME